MTHLHGMVVLEKGKHRLYPCVAQLCIICACVWKAFAFTARIPIADNTAGHIRCESAQFDVEVHLPAVGPIEGVIAGVEPRAIEIEFAPHKSVTGKGMGRMQPVFNYVASAAFSDFYERYVEWVRQHVHADVYQWPTAWRFARVVRNAISHSGSLNIDNPSAPTVTWHSLSYGPAHNKQRIIGADLVFADILILMTEMSDELDRLGCPI